MARAPYTITAAEVIGDHQLRLTFLDGTVGAVDLRGEAWVGVFAELADPAYFARVTLDSEMGTVIWPNGADMAADALYDDVLAAMNVSSPA
jgi:hypothetical protein